MRSGFCRDTVTHRDHAKSPYVEGRILFKWILVKYDWMKWSGLIWLRV